MKCLVIGARKDSLGESVAYDLRNRGVEVVTAGVSGEEDAYLDITDLVEFPVGALIGSHVVCTAGVNAKSMGYSMEVNVHGPVNLATQWKQLNRDSQQFLHWVSISSNSAFIPRTGSLAYCASKAALNMAMKCMARDAATEESPCIFYDYAPGFLLGTPMSDDVAARGYEQLHRMKGLGLQGGIHVNFLANMIADNLTRDHVSDAALNGTTFRIDAGEQ